MRETASGSGGSKNEDKYSLNAEFLVVEIPKICVNPYQWDHYQLIRQKGDMAGIKMWEVGEIGSEKCII